MYVYTRVRQCGVKCSIKFAYTTCCLRMEFFESTVPAKIVSKAPTFFTKTSFGIKVGLIRYFISYPTGISHA